MRKRISWWGIVAGLLLVPSLAGAQESSYEVPPVVFTGPLSHPGYENGGFYLGITGLYYRTNRPLNTASQVVATRGFVDNTGGISGQEGTFIGANTPALNTDMLRGPGTWEPGWDLFIAWKFQSGVAVELDWKHMVEAKYHAGASLFPQQIGGAGALLENTFLFAPVYNFPQQWAGPPFRVAIGNPGDVFGIWNGASVMDIEYIQRFDIYQLNVRVPIWQTESYRNYGIFGPRIVWIWDQFRWNTIDYDVVGATDPSFAALYTNMVSNRMYGVHCGCGNDWWLGLTPIGGFSFVLDLEGGLYIDLVKTEAKYERDDRVISASRSRRMTALVPSIEGRAGFTWYPWEGIQIHLNYDFMAFFNTVASPQPIDFNMGSIDPEYRNVFLRTFQGLQFGITFVF